MATNFEKLQKLLEELFQLDQADLDFGIYRIMNQKRDEVVRFLEKDLLPQVKEAFGHYKSADKATLQKELDKAIGQAEGLGVDPETTTKVKELREQMADSSVDVTALENEVFSHLFNFFRRYYHEGDFISLRRYKEGVYAIPYEGEEVKLHWANHDQYYVKSSEYFRDYIFTMPSGKRVRVHLVAASSEQDNKKEQAGKERRFVICEDDPIYEENGELFIRFEYKTDNGKKKQDALNQEAIERVLQAEGFEEWTKELAKLAPTEKNKDRTVLEKHLKQYTARNTFDYFIHKDLGGFLRRELDFYIKNEVMHLDDIEHDTVPRVEQYLSKIKVIRKIAHKIIQFLEQLENFQKKLWLKKKFVVETNYCITLDRVPEELYPEIAANDAQREEWVRLFAVDEIAKDLNGPGYSDPLSVEFLRTNLHLQLDTRFFDSQFVNSLINGIDDLDGAVDGLLVSSDNFQALQLLSRRYSKGISSIYVDPPYNTGPTEILYKNDYRNSSWLSLMADRIAVSLPLLDEEGCYAIAIDDYEMAHLCEIADQLFLNYDRNMVVVNHHPQGGMSNNISRTHEYMLMMTPLRKDILRGRQKSGDTEYRSFMLSGPGDNKSRTGRPNSFYALLIDESSNEIVGVEPPPPLGETYPTEKTSEGYVRRYPISPSGDEKVWCRSYDSAVIGLPNGEIVLSDSGTVKLAVDTTGKRHSLMSNWTDSRYNAGPHGTGLVADIMGDREAFSYPKSLFTVTDSVEAMTHLHESPTILDFFAGSATTAHAVMELNRQDNRNRKYVLVEMGSYFESVTKPRVQRVAYSSKWDSGKPVDRDGVSHFFKYVRLESYEDALNNLEMRRSDQQASLLEQDDDLREQYILSYMLDVESRGSQSLLNVESFRNPDEYKLRVEREGETQLVNVDLVETFNWLLGLTVKHIDVIRGVRVVEGTNPDGDRALVLWRNLDETDNDALDEWFKKQDYNTRDQEYDLIYANGDNNLENLRRGDQTWKVRLIEEEFGRLMFDVQDV